MNRNVCTIATRQEITDLIAELDHIHDLLEDSDMFDGNELETAEEELLCQTGTLSTIYIKFKKLIGN